MKKAVFLDRDGVITCDPPHYAHRLEQLKLVPKAAEAINILNKNNFKVIVVSNQSGVGRGYYTEDKTNMFNSFLRKELNKKNAYVDGFYYCPHHPEAKVKKYRVKCDCRKPNPGMLLKGSKDFNVDLNESFMIGDRPSDMEAGRKAGCKTIYVLSGMGKKFLEKQEIDADFTSKDLYEAVNNIILRL